MDYFLLISVFVVAVALGKYKKKAHTGAAYCLLLIGALIQLQVSRLLVKHFTLGTKHQPINFEDEALFGVAGAGSLIDGIYLVYFLASKRE
jgi:hypothetical protein